MHLEFYMYLKKAAAEYNICFSEVQEHRTLVNEMRVLIQRLEEDNDTLRKEAARYRTFWIGECRLKELLDWGHDKDGAISQPDWLASSPGPEFGEIRLKELEQVEKELELYRRSPSPLIL